MSVYLSQKFESSPPFSKMVDFSMIFEANKVVKIQLGVVDDFRTANWVEIIKYPELVYQKSAILLQI